MKNNKISLAEMIQTLREELEQAQVQGKNSKFKFKVDSVQAELSVMVSKSGLGKAGIKFWVVEAGAEFKEEDSVTHKFTLVLKPGSTGDIEVARDSQKNVLPI